MMAGIEEIEARLGSHCQGMSNRGTSRPIKSGFNNATNTINTTIKSRCFCVCILFRIYSYPNCLRCCPIISSSQLPLPNWPSASGLGKYPLQRVPHHVNTHHRNRGSPGRRYGIWSCQYTCKTFCSTRLRRTHS